MDESGIDLSLLEGMDEELLVRLHQMGIRTREDLEARIATGDGRRALAGEIGVSSRRLKILHHLNFLLPEERVERLLEMEARLETRVEGMDREFRQLWRAITGISIAVLVVFLLGVILIRPYRMFDREDFDRDVSSDRLLKLEDDLAALRPVGIAHAEDWIMKTFTELGPAPGWNGKSGWSRADDEKIEFLLGDDESMPPRRAISLALLQLARIENAPIDSLTPLERARQASEVAFGFPAIPSLDTAWDCAGILLRGRIRARALGLAPLDPDPPNISAAVPWTWTSPGFLICEEMMTRLESLPLKEEAIPLWSETLGQIRQAADVGRDRIGVRPEAFARDYWIRRGELELAVVAAMLNRADLLPYHKSSPGEFLLQRSVFLDQALARASGPAGDALSWLAVEYEEALHLVAWIAGRGGWELKNDLRWVEALDQLEEERRREGLSPDPGLLARTRAALGGGNSEDPMAAERTRWEAGLRPLLMEIRAGFPATSP